MKKALLRPPSPVRAETRTFPELRSRLANILNVLRREGAHLGALGVGGEIGTPAVLASPAASLDDLFDVAGSGRTVECKASLSAASRRLHQ